MTASHLPGDPSGSFRLDVPPEAPPDFYTEYAHKVCGLDPDWGWFKIEAIGYQLKDRAAQSTLLTGAIAPLSTRGKRAGQRLWKNRDKTTECQISIPFAALADFKRGWEIETGKCSSCGGSGVTLASFGASGRTYRKCHRCSGVGSAPDKPVQP